jgi:hypothetical protein
MSIQIARSEVARLATRPWGQMDMRDRKFLVSRILAARGDLATANLVEMGNPRYQDFVLINDSLDSARFRVKV